MMTRGQKRSLGNTADAALLSLAQSNSGIHQLQQTRNALFLEQQRAQAVAQLGAVSSMRFHTNGMATSAPTATSMNARSDQLSRAYLELTAASNATSTGGASNHQQRLQLEELLAANSSALAPLQARSCFLSGSSSLGQQQQQQQQHQVFSSNANVASAARSSLLSNILSGGTLNVNHTTVNAATTIQQAVAAQHQQQRHQQRQVAAAALNQQRCQPVHTNNNNPATGRSQGNNSKKRGSSMTILAPCRARGMPVDHNPKTAHFIISEDLEHGTELVCSYPACRNTGVKFCFCAYCQTPVAKRNFRKRHMHDHEDGKNPNHTPTSTTTTSITVPQSTTTASTTAAIMMEASPGSDPAARLNMNNNHLTVGGPTASSGNPYSEAPGAEMNHHNAQTTTSSQRISDTSSGNTPPGQLFSNSEKMRQVIRKLLSESSSNNNTAGISGGVATKRAAEGTNDGESVALAGDNDEDIVIKDGKKSCDEKGEKSENGEGSNGNDNDELSSMSGNSDDEYRGLIRAHSSRINANIAAKKTGDSGAVALGRENDEDANQDGKTGNVDEINALESWVKLLFSRPTTNSDPQSTSSWILQVLQTSGDFHEFLSSEM
uniref:Uncharacterized protein n=1 Tax=Leptocylindrus danicus TaxID=163516 RepID=A0A7S2JUH4_9STRA